jgi:hypothetical protein
MRTTFLLLVMIAGSVAAKADAVIYTETATAGQFLYDFTVTNTGATGGALYDLFLSAPLGITSIDTTSIGTPVGWGDPTGGLLFFGPDIVPGTSFIEWADDPSGFYDIGIGNSLAGFSFVSSLEVNGPIMFALNGSTTLEYATPLASVPEPHSAFLLLLCIAALASSLVLRRNRSR